MQYCLLTYLNIESLYLLLHFRITSAEATLSWHWTCYLCSHFRWWTVSTCFYINFNMAVSWTTRTRTRTRQQWTWIRLACQGLGLGLGTCWVVTGLQVKSCLLSKWISSVKRQLMCRFDWTFSLNIVAVKWKRRFHNVTYVMRCFYINYWWLKYCAEARDDAMWSVYCNIIDYCFRGLQRLHRPSKLRIKCSVLTVLLVWCVTVGIIFEITENWIPKSLFCIF